MLIAILISNKDDSLENLEAKLLSMRNVAASDRQITYLKYDEFFSQQLLLAQFLPRCSLTSYGSFPRFFPALLSGEPSSAAGLAVFCAKLFRGQG